MKQLKNEIEGKQVITYLPKEDPDLLYMTKHFLLNDLYQDDFKRKENYFPPRLILEDELAISIVLYNKKIISFSTLSRSPLHSDCARICSRYYTIPEHRTFTRPIKKVNMEVMVQQIHFLQLYKNIIHAFASREAPTLRYMQALEKAWNNYFPHKWTLAEDLLLVCYNKFAKGCWQHVLYTSYNKDKFPLLMESKTVKEWQNLTY